MKTLKREFANPWAAMTFERCKHNNGFNTRYMRSGGKRIVFWSSRKIIMARAVEG